MAFAILYLFTLPSTVYSWAFSFFTFPLFLQILNLSTVSQSSAWSNLQNEDMHRTRLAK